MALKQETFLSRKLAPEEIRPKQYVAVLATVIEFLTDTCDDAAWKTLQVRQVEVLPWAESQPRRVEAVCLPFVLVKSADGEYSTVDIRRHRLALVDRAFGEHIFRICRDKRRKAMAKAAGRRKKRRSK